MSLNMNRTGIKKPANAGFNVLVSFPFIVIVASGARVTCMCY